MNNESVWLNQTFIDRVRDGKGGPGLPHGRGLFALCHDGEPRRADGQGQGYGQGQGHGLHGERSPALRTARLLRAVGLRFARLSDAVVGWMSTGNALLIVVSLSDEYAEREEAEVDAGRLAFLLRDLAVKAFAGASERGPALGGELRCGFGWIYRPGSAAARPETPATLQNGLFGAIRQALEQARTAEKTVVRLPVARLQDVRPERQIEVRYSPIASLLDGSLYGYEAIPYDAVTGVRIDIRAYYETADSSGLLFESDRRFREAAIRGFPSRNGDVKLFLPVPSKIIFDPRLYPGSTLRRIEAAGLRAEHVVLVLVGGEEERNAAMKAALSHYRLQGFRIALSGITPSRASLRRMVELHPEYAQVNVEWVNGQAMDTVEECLLQAMTTLSRKEQIVWIANGLDREAMLPALIASGMNYGQGRWIGREQAGSAELDPQVQRAIRGEINRRYRGAAGSMSELALPVQQFRRETLVSEIARHFELHREAQGFVIADEGRPIGLLMKEKLHQMLAGQFGLPLYWNRPVGKIMDTHPMIVDEFTPVDQVSHMAMAREPDKLYDAVILTRQGVVSGIVSIRALLEWVTTSRMADAQWANPLTGLPGNEPIRRELIRRLADERPFAVWYVDLDHFKWYNDQYGFHRGDDVIRYTGEVLMQGLRVSVADDFFVGHIGGDDFIVLSACDNSEEAVHEVLNRFADGIAAFAGQLTGPVTDRSGKPVEADGLSLSVAMLVCRAKQGWTPERISERATLLKKRAKLQPGNSFVLETTEDSGEFVAPASKEGH